ncbi:MAG: ASCH domain-containing protein [Desulfurococcales archaeon]|nr:ASCH domain-containing protein [Desulfurococcales archaeon]MCE4605514.1 ASCH domain-containing protein [Desulfurococcales archaeon]
MPGRGNNIRRVQYLGRHLMIRGEYVEKLLSGEKKATIRAGIVKPRYSEVIIHGGGRPVAKAVIEGVEVKRLSDLTDEDARLDGFKSRGELVGELRRTYKWLGPGDPVTIIRLRVTKRLDEAESDDPYMGLEPGDIARIALRYLKDLSGDEARVLRLLTQTNSIREATLILYKDLSQRWRVRKVLRRALKRLVEEGVLGGPHS